MLQRVYWPIPDMGACRIFAQVIISLPVIGRSYGSGDKSTAAIRADILQYGFYTGYAEGAFIGADTRLN